MKYAKNIISIFFGKMVKLLKPKTIKLYFRVLIPLSVVIVSGCIQSGADVTPILQQLPAIQQFLEEHPDANIQVSFLDSVDIANQIEQIRDICGDQFDIGDYYRAVYTEGNIKMTVYLDYEELKAVCMVKKGEGIPGGYCGDDVCDEKSGENKNSCPQDCGTCPQISSPSPNFCPDGKTKPKYDRNGCLTGYDCIKRADCPADTKECPDGTVVSRNPDLNCGFDPCPEVNCTQEICDNYTVKLFIRRRL